MIRVVLVLTSFGLLASCGPDGMAMAPATAPAPAAAAAPTNTNSLGDLMTGGTMSSSTNTVTPPAPGY